MKLVNLLVLAIVCLCSFAVLFCSSLTMVGKVLLGFIAIAGLVVWLVLHPRRVQGWTPRSR